MQVNSNWLIEAKKLFIENYLRTLFNSFHKSSVFAFPHLKALR